MFKKFAFPLIYGLILASYSTYAVLDTFVIEKKMSSVSFDDDFFGDDDSSYSSMSSIIDPSSSENKPSSSSKDDQPSSSSSSSSNQDKPSSSDSSSSEPGKSSSSSSSSSSNPDKPSSSSSSSSTPRPTSIISSWSSPSFNIDSEVVPVDLNPNNEDFFTTNEVLTETRYSNKNIWINIQFDKIQVKNKSGKTVNTRIYTADIRLRSIKYLKTALAKNTFGENVTEKTSEMALANNAVFAVNGDYYGAQQKGYVIRNGTRLRDTAKSKDNDNGDLAIYTDGSFYQFFEKDHTLDEIQSLKSAQGLKAYQVFSFGPNLVVDGKRNVTESDEVAVFSTMGNQRCSIGRVSDLHYIISVCDGRLSNSWGLELYQLADYMIFKGCQSAYNLDGGGSATIVFNGRLLNRPNTNGDRDIKERSISDIVYIPYE